MSGLSAKYVVFHLVIIIIIIITKTIFIVLSS